MNSPLNLMFKLQRVRHHIKPYGCDVTQVYMYVKTDEWKLLAILCVSQSSSMHYPIMVICSAKPKFCSSKVEQVRRWHLRNFTSLVFFGLFQRTKESMIKKPPIYISQLIHPWFLSSLHSPSQQRSEEAIGRHEKRGVEAAVVWQNETSSPLWFILKWCQLNLMLAQPHHKFLLFSRLQLYFMIVKVTVQQCDKILDAFLNRTQEGLMYLNNWNCI